MIIPFLLFCTIWVHGLDLCNVLFFGHLFGTYQCIHDLTFIVRKFKTFTSTRSRTSTTSADRGQAIGRALDPSSWAETNWGRFFTAGGRLKVPLEMVRKTMAPVLNWLDDYNTAMENGVRLAAYKAGLDAGMSKERAASIAKNLTTNFNRKGQVAQQVGALYAFFNASMQGTARIGEALFTMEPGQPKTLRLSALGRKVVSGGVLLGAGQALMLAAAGLPMSGTTFEPLFQSRAGNRSGLAPPAGSCIPIQSS